MRVLFFAWLREKAGTGALDVTPPEAVATVGGLMDWLADDHEGAAKALADRSVVRVAVNQDYVDLDHAVKPGDEVAFFPPVTGG
ncbi:MAG: molybdopterin converting factor subunit 1 [Magnetovibrionaceae bacterium]